MNWKVNVSFFWKCTIWLNSQHYEEKKNVHSRSRACVSRQLIKLRPAASQFEFREIRGIKHTLLPSSISKGQSSQREKKISFLGLEIGSKLRLLDFRWEIKSFQSVGRNLPQTISDCAAATKVLETADNRQASGGVVSDMILATTPSGSEEKPEISSPSVAFPFPSSSINLKIEEYWIYWFFLRDKGIIYLPSTNKFQNQ